MKKLSTYVAAAFISLNLIGCSDPPTLTDQQARALLDFRLDQEFFSIESNYVIDEYATKRGMLELLEAIQAITLERTKIDDKEVWQITSINENVVEFFSSGHNNKIFYYFLLWDREFDRIVKVRENQSRSAGIFNSNPIYKCDNVIEFNIRITPTDLGRLYKERVLQLSGNNISAVACARLVGDSWMLHDWTTVFGNKAPY